ncbi:MAG TPA: hypothetical protein VKA54_23925 [Gemmatimonadaceae bacterium]|nr:hypothetical protein [Gemmatimonadaceae bacterium]
MRIRTAVIAVALLIPSVATAQRRAPGIGGRVPGLPMPDGRQPEAIARSQAFVRSRYSVEAYPLISRVAAPGLAAGSPTSRWTSFGSGTRLDWRQTDYLSWTIDLTASYLGGPAVTETAELGTRIRPKNWNDRVRPFADLRVGFEHVSQSLSNQDLGFGPASIRSGAVRYGRGFGAVAGAGVEYFLTNTVGVTTAVSAMRSNMTAYNFTGVSVPTTESSYRMTTYRLAVGIRYNPVRYLRLASTTTP